MPLAQPSAGRARRGASCCTALSCSWPCFARACSQGRNKLGLVRAPPVLQGHILPGLGPSGIQSLGTQPGSPGPQSIAPGMQPGCRGAQAVGAMTQPRAPSLKSSSQEPLARVSRGAWCGQAGLDPQAAAGGKGLVPRDPALGSPPPPLSGAMALSQALLQETRDLKAAQSQMAEQMQKIPGVQLQSAVQEMKRELNELQEQQKTSKATLEEMVAKTADQQAQQDETLLEELQASVTHLQREYKHLSSVTGNLQDDWQKQKKYAKALLKSLRKLEKDKADKEDVMHETAEKAGKSSLASKVSQDHFEGILEQLREKLEEMESQQVTKEQDLQEMQQRLMEAVDAKLDRQELGPLQRQLAQLKTILEQLKEKGTQPDHAAGIECNKAPPKPHGMLHPPRPVFAPSLGVSHPGKM
ncbi:ensconsin-like isoform X2 [Cuculus canorus]|uniref:ensconsin-like isoform X2 n=1 Tax=Cuculus canorus TaxID=55661 RepID=UPI0023AA96B2|nr:ensconsin-like isoform X2 [Cuculus canorus]